MPARLWVDFRSDGYTIQHVAPSPTPTDAESSRRQADSSLLTKSRYFTGLDNPQEMWYEFRGSLSPDLGEQWGVEQGQSVGEVALQEYPNGAFVGGPLNEIHLRSNDLLSEVTVQEKGLLVRSDILRPSDASGWILMEVKSSTLKRRSSQKDAK